MADLADSPPSDESASATVALTTLQPDVLECVLSLLDSASLCRFGSTCHQFRQAADSGSLWVQQLRSVGVTTAGLTHLCNGLVGEEEEEEEETNDSWWVLEAGDDKPAVEPSASARRLPPSTSARRLYLRWMTQDSCEIELLRRRATRASVAIELCSCFSVPLWLLFAPVREGKSWLHHAAEEPGGLFHLPLAAGGMRCIGYTSLRGELVMGRLSTRGGPEASTEVVAVRLPPHKNKAGPVTLNNYLAHCDAAAHVEFDVVLASTVELQSAELTMSLNDGVINLQSEWGAVLTGQLMALEREGFVSSFAWERRVHRSLRGACHPSLASSHRKWASRGANHDLAFDSPELSVHRGAETMLITPLRISRVKAHAIT